MFNNSNNAFNNQLYLKTINIFYNSKQMLIIKSIINNTFLYLSGCLKERSIPQSHYSLVKLMVSLRKRLFFQSA